MTKLDRINKQVRFIKEMKDDTINDMIDEIQRQVPDVENINISLDVYGSMNCYIYGYHFYIDRYIDIKNVKPDCSDMPEDEDDLLIAMRERKIAIKKARAALLIFKYMIMER